MSIFDKGIAQRRSVDALIAAKAVAEAQVAEAMKTLSDAQRTLCNAGFGVRAIQEVFGRESFFSFHENNGADTCHSIGKKLDRDLWTHLGNITNITSMMDAKAKKEWSDQINEKTPPCNLETLEATFTQLHANSDLIFKRGMVNTFKTLCKKYKTNDAFKVGKKIIVSHATSWHGSGEDTLVDFERCLYVLDKKPPPEYKDGVRQVINNARYKGLDEWENEYFRIKFFKNGNAHVWILKTEHLDSINKIIAAFYGDTLPNNYT